MLSVLWTEWHLVSGASLPQVTAGATLAGIARVEPHALDPDIEISLHCYHAHAAQYSKPGMHRTLRFDVVLSGDTPGKRE
jgi:hypothetical protein